MRPGVCLHASCLIRCAFCFLFSSFSFWSVLLENLKWKRSQSKSGEQRKKKLQFLYWSFARAQQQQQQQWQQKRGKVTGQTPLYEWTFRRIMSFSRSSYRLWGSPIFLFWCVFFFWFWCDATHPMLKLCTHSYTQTQRIWPGAQEAQADIAFSDKHSNILFFKQITTNSNVYFFSLVFVTILCVCLFSSRSATRNRCMFLRCTLMKWGLLNVHNH